MKSRFPILVSLLLLLGCDNKPDTCTFRYGMVNDLEFDIKVVARGEGDSVTFSLAPSDTSHIWQYELFDDPQTGCNLFFLYQFGFPVMVDEMDFLTSDGTLLRQFRMDQVELDISSVFTFYQPHFVNGEELRLYVVDSVRLGL